MLTPALRVLLRRKSVESRSDRPFELRPYQLEIAWRTSSLIVRGRHILVDLPTGAGKTQVAVLATLFARHRAPRASKKALYIVPSRILIDQVVQALGWVHPELTRVGITERIASNAFHLRAAATSADILITTPGLFASLLRRGILPESDFISNLLLVILDEFDEYLILDAERTAYRVRFDTNLVDLRSFITGVPTLLMSGTAPSALDTLLSTPTSTYFAQFIRDVYAPVLVSVNPDEYSQHIPIAVIREVPCVDPYVLDCEKALGYRIHHEIERYECEHHVRLDSSYLMSRLTGLAQATIPTVRLSGGGSRKVDASLRRLCSVLLDLLNKYQFLYEDMFRDIEPREVAVPVVEDCIPTHRRQRVYVLDDLRPSSDHFEPELRGKAYALLSLVTQHRKKRVLVFTRHIQVSDALKDFLEARDILVRQVDSRLKSDWERYDVLSRFQTSSGCVLIITRGTGRRGLDIPMADLVILYSPKSDEYVVWQELSRIRSTLSRAKPSYILYYANTTEHKRLEHLRRDMEMSGHRYRFEDYAIQPAPRRRDAVKPARAGSQRD